MCVSRRLWSISIIKDVPPWNKILLATIAVAINCMSMSKSKYESLQTCVPFMDKKFVPLKENNAYCRAFSDEDRTQVYKLFSRSDETFKCNLELMKIVGIPVTTENLTLDGEYFYLKYPLYPGDNEPKNLKQFRIMLDKVHSAGYVHCDIRIANLIFGPNGTDSYLIDYDLARVNETDIYPVGY